MRRESLRPPLDRLRRAAELLHAVLDLGCRQPLLDWDTTVEWAQLLGLATVPVLYDGAFDEDWLRELEDELDLDRCEGYVVRLAEGFAFAEFGVSVAKWVRAHHVQTDQHWMHQELVPNGLAPAPEPEPAGGEP